MTETLEKEYGYKAYGPDGCQMTDDAAAIVYAEIQKTDVLNGAKVISFAEGVEKGLIKFVGDDCKDAFYKAIEDIEAAMKGMLDPIFEEKVIGHAQVRQVFKASGVGSIAGSYVLDGAFQRGCKVRISRTSWSSEFYCPQRQPCR